MPAKLQGTLGQRIKQSYESHGWKRTEFHRRLIAIRPEILYGQIIKWENGATPKPENLHAISEASGYPLSEFTDGYGVAIPVLPHAASAGSRDAITRLMQSGELAPFSDADLRFLETCVAAEPKISASKLKAGLIGFRAAMGDDESRGNYRQAVTDMRATSSFPPPPNPASTIPNRPRRPPKKKR